MKLGIIRKCSYGFCRDVESSFDPLGTGTSTEPGKACGYLLQLNLMIALAGKRRTLKARQNFGPRGLFAPASPSQTPGAIVQRRPPRERSGAIRTLKA